MGNLIVKVFFSILNFISNVFLNPLFRLFTGVFPVLTSFFAGVLTFIGYGLQYTAFFVNLLMIPKILFIAVISFFIFIYGINISLRVIGMGSAIFHYFKP